MNPRTSTQLRFILRTLLCAATIMVSAGYMALATVHQVPQQFESISDAIKAASPGDVIEISSGTYHENLVVDKALTLRGLPGEELQVLLRGEVDWSPVLRINLEGPSRVIVEDLTFGISNPGSCISVNSDLDSQVYVRSCRFVFDSVVANRDEPVVGVRVLGGTATILNSTFDGPNTSLAFLDRSNGVLSGGYSVVTVRQCEFQDFEDGVQTRSGQYLAVYDCTILRAMGSLTIWNSEAAESHIKLTNNRMRDCLTGIVLMGNTSFCEISNNRIFDSRWKPFRIHLASICDDDGVTFTGTLTGTGNRIDDSGELCPAEDDSFWPAGFLH